MAKGKELPSLIEPAPVQAEALFNYALENNIDLRRRIVNITGEIDETIFLTIDIGLTELEAHSGKAITIKINSMGGDPYQAMAIVGRLRESPCRIITKGYGHIMSAATVILACGDLRKMSKYATFMWHEFSYSLGEQKHTDSQNYVDQTQIEWGFWAEQMAIFSKESSEFWRKSGSSKDVYFSPKNLRRMGVVDEIF